MMMMRGEDIADFKTLLLNSLFLNFSRKCNEDFINKIFVY